MNLIYGVKDKPKFTQVLVFAIQQVLAILVATITVPASVSPDLSLSAALFGAGVGTIVYLLFTGFKSPVFLGSSFAFIGSMVAAFGGAVSMELGYLGLVIGAVFAGLVYVIISIIVKFCGINWIGKIMPAVVIGPTVAIIGLSCAGFSVSLMNTGDYVNELGQATASPYVLLLCALVSIAVVAICSVYSKKMMKLIPFVMGILSGYALALIFTVIGIVSGNDALKIVNFAPFAALVEGGVGIKTFISLPDFTLIHAIRGFKDITFDYIVILAIAYAPVAFVVFAEHIADHKNLSSIIGTELLEDPGLHRTLLGDGIGSMAGALFGGCPNTTYGESIACVALTGNASVVSILTASVIALLAACVSPFVALLQSIPSCVLGGVTMSLYGFIAVSGLKMLQPLDLSDNKNIFVISAILISGVGGLSVTFGKITHTTTACALILGILVNLLVNRKKAENTENEENK
ncbi:MAG: uracil-xanthine permease [Clostridiales bacterium]|nr:uracil-xanthine permease [Clostridiales bacterium]